MFSNLSLKNLGAFTELEWPEHGAVNVIIGENDTGKSHLLKTLYVIAKGVEEYSRKPAHDKDTWRKVVSEKLRWTFQPSPDLGSLLHHGAHEMKVRATFREHTYDFSLDRLALQKDPTLVRSSARKVPAQEGGNALFIPTKEILTAFSAIAVTRETLEIYGFDDTYYDLIKLLRIPPTHGEIDEALTAVLTALEALFGGQIVKQRSSDSFTFVRGKSSFGMPQTADGIKKIGILTTLIKNRSLNSGSILFLDEPETNLHPRAIAVFMKMLFLLGLAGVQIYLATHSYFVIKQLQILAKQHQTPVPFCSLTRKKKGIDARFADLAEGMPDNPIVDEFIRLYEQELTVDLAGSGGK